MNNIIEFLTNQVTLNSNHDEFNNRIKNVAENAWQYATPIIAVLISIFGVVAIGVFIQSIYKYVHADSASERKGFMIKMGWTFGLVVFLASLGVIVELIIKPLTLGQEIGSTNFISIELMLSLNLI